MHLDFSLLPVVLSSGYAARSRLLSYHSCQLSNSIEIKVGGCTLSFSTNHWPRPLFSLLVLLSFLSSTVKNEWPKYPHEQINKTIVSSTSLGGASGSPGSPTAVRPLLGNIKTPMAHAAQSEGNWGDFTSNWASKIYIHMQEYTCSPTIRHWLSLHSSLSPSWLIIRSIVAFSWTLRASRFTCHRTLRSCHSSSYAALQIPIYRRINSQPCGPEGLLLPGNVC